MAYGTGQINSTAPSAPRDRTLLENVNQGLAAHADELHAVAQRLHRLADRVIGSRPEAVGKAEATPPDSSLMQAFARNGDAMSNALRGVIDATERLETL